MQHTKGETDATWVENRASDTSRSDWWMLEFACQIGKCVGKAGGRRQTKIANKGKAFWYLRQSSTGVACCVTVHCEYDGTGSKSRTRRRGLCYIQVRFGSAPISPLECGAEMRVSGKSDAELRRIRHDSMH